MQNSYFNILTGIARPTGEKLLILGAVSANTAKSSKENITDNRKLANMVPLGDT